MGQTVDRQALKTFAGEGQTIPYSRRSIITGLDPELARQYDNQGLTGPTKKAPSKAAAQASAADNKASAAKAKETKESPAKDTGGLEPWDGALSEEAYVARFGGDPSASDSVKEKVKLAKARIKAGASQGTQG